MQARQLLAMATPLFDYATAKLLYAPQFSGQLSSIRGLVDDFKVLDYVEQEPALYSAENNSQNYYQGKGKLLVAPAEADTSVLAVAVNTKVAFMLLSFMMIAALGKRLYSTAAGLPLHKVGGSAASLLHYSHTLLCMYAQLFQFTMTLRWGVQGSLIAMFYQFGVCVLLDLMISDSPWENFKSLRRNNFKNWQIITSLVTCQIVWSSNSFWVWYFVPDFTIAFSCKALLSLVFSLAAAEAVFTSAHVFMHQYKFLELWIHKFHHCCLSASVSSNYIFNPIDGLLESFGPWLAAWAVYEFVMKDAFGLWLSLYVIQAWYTMDHDENIRTPHWFHHKYIDSEYTSYVAIKFRNIKDQLRVRVKRAD